MSKRPGAVSADTRERILQAAGDEFAEHGFQGSSLRRICAAAGVTTGAIYFFFQGKDDLFETVLSGVTTPFLAYMREHYRQEQQLLIKAPVEKEHADLEISLTLIDFYFRSRRTWDILLKHLGHPAVQSFLDCFVEESTDHYLSLITMADGGQPRSHPVDRFAIHQFAHMQTDTMLTLISHDFSREEMTEHARTVTNMLRGAFQVLLSD